MRGATPWTCYLCESCQISIHAPHAGRDEKSKQDQRIYKKFQSTRPMRGATDQTFAENPRLIFQSTRPMRGATGDGYFA